MKTKCIYYLRFRLKDSDLKVSVEKASEVAKKTERELFHMYKDTDNKYKNKYRSLMFNLKDTKNNVSIKSGRSQSKPFPVFLVLRPESTTTTYVTPLF